MKDNKCIQVFTCSGYNCVYFKADDIGACQYFIAEGKACTSKVAQVNKCVLLLKEQGISIYSVNVPKLTKAQDKMIQILKGTFEVDPKLWREYYPSEVATVEALVKKGLVEASDRCVRLKW